MKRTATRPVLAAGALALFFLSFLMSAASNVLAQLFLERHAVQDRPTLLSLALLLSTVAAAAGVLLSRRIRLARAAVPAALAGVAVLAQSLLATASVPLFVTLLVLLQFAVNLLVDQVDHAAVIRCGGLAGFNDTAGNGARLAGMLAAPAYFTLLPAGSLVERAGVACISAAAVAGAILLLRIDAEQPSLAHPAARGNTPPLPRDRVFFGHAAAVYAGMYLFAANAIYLLRDVFRMPDADARGGSLIVAVFAAAIVANGAAGRLARGPAARPRLLPLLAPAAALAVAALVPLAGWRPGYAACVAAATLVGAGYGFFLRELRGYASAAARAGRGVVLGWFNNMANVSALAAFALMFVLSRVAPPAGFYDALMLAVVALQVGGAGLLLAGAARTRAGVPAA